jgi:hypothetical protein
MCGQSGFYQCYTLRRTVDFIKSEHEFPTEQENGPDDPDAAFVVVSTGAQRRARPERHAPTL